MATDEERYEVQATGTYVRRDGTPIFYPAGTRIPYTTANQFPAFVAPGDEFYVPGASDVRPLSSATYDESIYSEDL